MVFQGLYIIPSQTKIENLRHLHPALGFLSFRKSRPWWETPRRFPRSDGPKWLLFWMIIFLHHMIFRLIKIIEGSLEVKLPTIWTVEKQR